MGKVLKLTDVKDIDRNIFIDNKNYDEFKKLLPQIYMYFGKKECMYSQRTKIKHYIITIIKNMCRQLVLKLVKKYKNIQNKGVVKSYIFYSIECQQII
jgi:hypothetical protein